MDYMSIAIIIFSVQCLLLGLLLFVKRSKAIKNILISIFVLCTFFIVFCGLAIHQSTQRPNIVTNQRELPFPILPEPIFKQEIVYVVEVRVILEPIYPEGLVIEEKAKPPELKYNFTDNDKYLMSRLLCGSKYIDGDGEYDFDYGLEDNLDQISLVLSVVMNRVMDDRFPDTVGEVILQNKPCFQFEPVAKWASKGHVEISDIAKQRVEEWCDAYNNNMKGVPNIPDSHIYFTSNGRGKNVSRKG